MTSAPKMFTKLMRYALEPMRQQRLFYVFTYMSGSTVRWLLVVDWYNDDTIARVHLFAIAF